MSALEVSGRAILIVQCDSESQLQLAFVFPKKEFDTTAEAPSTLFVKSNDDSPVALDAKLQDWNDNYAGVVASGRTDEMIKVIFGIGGAKKKIQVGTETLGDKKSTDFGTSKSTSAISVVFDKCKISRPKK